eukprot:TRINITY_DN36428_c0_g1_i1.p1 TRINITY_DN36428_c0_g1~~TRINITY_DN36428_c0_g1_i1.p1  ORF type:complete len:381 (-),score=43.20 TRINITY_DN36428_c0_g1_i1:152-1294(-)
MTPSRRFQGLKSSFASLVLLTVTPRVCLATRGRFNAGDAGSFQGVPDAVSPRSLGAAGRGEAEEALSTLPRGLTDSVAAKVLHRQSQLPLSAATDFVSPRALEVGEPLEDTQSTSELQTVTSVLRGPLHKDAGDVAAEFRHVPSQPELKLALERRRFEVELQSMKDVLERHEAEPGSKSAPAPGPGKIAFLFMLEGRLEQPEIWRQFFEEADERNYSIYVHNGTDTQHSSELFAGFMKYQEVPHAAGGWCALMGMELGLISAALPDPLNEQFVIVGHDAVPLKPFEYIYRDLIVNSRETSKFCFAQERSAAGDKRCNFRHDSSQPGIPKHHQWIILSRLHAKAMKQKGVEALVAFDEVRRRKIDPGMCSDESVPATALLK